MGDAKEVTMRRRIGPDPMTSLLGRPPTVMDALVDTPSWLHAADTKKRAFQAHARNARYDWQLSGADTRN